MHALVHAAGFFLAAIVSPPRCAACDAVVRYATAFCPACAGTLVRADTKGGSRLAAFAYGGALAEAIRRFKFEDRPDLAAPLAAALRTLAPELRGQQLDVVVPVPLHPRRLVERGYNQAALLARPLARELGVELRARALTRRAATARQSELSRVARASNVANAFAVGNAAAIRGRTVLLVDDVETTGATIRACAEALLAAGARAVSSAVLARAELGAAAVIDRERHTHDARAL